MGHSRPNEPVRATSDLPRQTDIAEPHRGLKWAEASVRAWTAAIWDLPQVKSGSQATIDVPSIALTKKPSSIPSQLSN
jgi:hypothetical protein